jgi:NADPH:quinone reductase-like Zn-dependent oxidoreductase
VLYGGYDATRGGKLRPGAVVDMLLNNSLSILGLFSASQGVVGYNVTSWRDARPAAFRQDLTMVMDLIGSGELDPMVARVLPLTEAAEGQRLLEGATLAGKIVLKP